MNIENLNNLPKDNFFIHVQENRNNSQIIKEIIFKYYSHVNRKQVSFTGSGACQDGYCVYNGEVDYTDEKFAESKELIIYKSPQEFIEKHSQPQIVTDYNIF